MSQIQDRSGLPNRPPVEPGALPPPPAKWPKVMGIVGAIWAGLGMAGGLCGIGWAFYMPTYFKWVRDNNFMPPEQVDATIAMQAPAMWTLASAAIGFVFSVFLMIGSVRLLKRRLSGAKMVTMWAWISIPWIALSITLSMALAPGLPPNVTVDSAMVQQQQIWTYMGVGCMVVLSMAWPVFCVIWFARRRVRDQVAMWSEIPAEVI